ncbi:MAG: MacB family efflux pump subunit [Candidatus Adiutrix sp.]|jgi:macrolide transport system ATP-binding/permease protein|nr:MacB family efflux pump subunit [Candidatus Adiutrix sp.]
MNIIEISRVNKFYGQGENRVQVLKDIDLSVSRGDFVAIIGQSGSGKTTLMNTMGCLDVPTSGTYRIDGIETSGLSANALAWVRGHKIGFIFQRYNLLASLSALDNVALPAVYTGLSYNDRTDRARELLIRLGLADRLQNRPNQLSGGQQQRVSIARALMNGGEVILADEPTGALDSKSGETLMGLLQQLHQGGHTIILVTHDPTIASYAHRVIEIKDGLIIADTRRVAEAGAGYQNPVDKKVNPLAFYRDQFIEAFKMSLQAIQAHKLRSLLTMLGIIIGIASVVSVIALGRGSQERIMANISSMGTNTINIYPGTGFGDRHNSRIRTLTVSDSDLLSQQSYIDSSTPSTSASGNLAYGNQTLTASLNGVGDQYFEVKGLKIDRGRLLTPADIKEVASVVVIDPNTRDKLFPNGENPLGQVLIFRRQPLIVIGVTQPQEAMFGPSDQLTLWSPYTTVLSKITGDHHISSIIVKISDTVGSQVAEKNLTALLTVKHGGRKDFFTQNIDSIKRTIESTSQTMTILISSIAFISLVVGGIGVMNIMLVSVTERTREIGVRMAIGAKRFNILEQFLIEAVLLCLIGGLAGIALAGLIGLGFNELSSDFKMSFSTPSIFLALGCSSFIGVLFGFMPARNASRLNPIDALSYD